MLKRLKIVHYYAFQIRSSFLACIELVYHRIAFYSTSLSLCERLERYAAAAVKLETYKKYHFSFYELVFVMDPRWKHPWTSMICGLTSCGKTIFVKNFLKYVQDMSSIIFDRVIVCYAEWQPAYKELAGNVEFYEGLPKYSNFDDDPRPKLLIIDDLMQESTSGGNVIP